MPPRPDLRLDVLVAAALTVMAQFEIWLAGAPAWPAVPLCLAATLALGWRRRAPLAAGLVVAGAVMAMEPLGARDVDVLALLLALVLSAFSVGAQRLHREAALGALAMIALLWTSVAQSRDDDYRSFVFTSLIVAVPALAGRAWGRRHAVTRAAITQERERIARELHDIIGHNVSLIGLQAGAGRRLLDEQPERAREALLAVEGLSRQTIDEMRRLLLLRAGGGEAALAPQPGLEELEAIAARVREHAGVPVALETDVRGELPAGVQLAVVRIVQEALTNAVRHGAPRSVDVTVRERAATLTVDVVDDGTGSGTAGGGGRGLQGMRERAELYGGELSAGPEPGGGWAVRARFPLTGAA